MDDRVLAWLIANAPHDLDPLPLERMRPAWHDQAACRGEPTGTFILERGGNSVRAKSICATCPVSPSCLRSALDDPDLVGIWGGTTAKERHLMRAASA